MAGGGALASAVELGRFYDYEALNPRRKISKKKKGERKDNKAKITESKGIFFLQFFNDTSHSTEKEGKLIYQISKP